MWTVVSFRQLFNLIVLRTSQAFVFLGLLALLVLAFLVWRA